MNRRMRSLRAGGFTLIELMIALAILAILVSIAYPSYTEYVIRSKRTEGKRLLNQIAAEQERFYTARNQYSNSITGARPAGLNIADVSEEECYRARVVVAAGGQAYTLTAVPQNSPDCGDQTVDTKCGTLGINSLGVKTSTGSLPVEQCW